MVRAVCVIMATQILVPLDGSPQSYGALEYALEQYTDLEITMLHVADPTELLSHSPIQLTEESATHVRDEIFEEAHSMAAEYNTRCESVAEVGQPSRVIVTHAEESEIDQIIMGSHGRTGASRVLLGSVAEAVVRRAPTPVTIVRSSAGADEYHQIDRVLVPIDEGDPSAAALEHAVDTFPDTDVTVLHVTDPIEGYEREDGLDPEADTAAGTYLEEWIEEADERAASLLDDAKGVAAAHGSEIETAHESGQPAQEIVAYAETNEFDHLVIGSHGRTGTSRVLLGSVAETIIRRAHCPVTAIR